LRRTVIRALTVTTAAACLILTSAGPALAHAEIKLDNPQAGATNVTLTMTTEAESDAAGITSVRVVLPAGITPDQISLTSGPSGWTLTPGTDGYTVGGTALPVHTDAKLVTRIAQLPANAGVLAFKTLVTYGNGAVDRWIEVPSSANPQPKNPAPTVSLKPAAVVPSPSAESSSAAAPSSPSASSTPASPTSSPATATASDSASALPWILAGLAALIAVALAVFLLRRRRTATPS
jgi:uncharacterized protein YcnI